MKSWLLAPMLLPALSTLTGMPATCAGRAMFGAPRGVLLDQLATDTNGRELAVPAHTRLCPIEILREQLAASDCIALDIEGDAWLDDDGCIGVGAPGVVYVRSHNTCPQPDGAPRAIPALHFDAELTVVAADQVQRRAWTSGIGGPWPEPEHHSATSRPLPDDVFDDGRPVIHVWPGTYPFVSGASDWLHADGLPLVVDGAFVEVTGVGARVLPHPTEDWASQLVIEAGGTLTVALVIGDERHRLAEIVAVQPEDVATFQAVGWLSVEPFWTGDADPDDVLAGLPPATRLEGVSGISRTADGAIIHGAPWRGLDTDELQTMRQVFDCVPPTEASGLFEADITLFGPGDLHDTITVSWGRPEETWQAVLEARHRQEFEDGVAPWDPDLTLEQWLDDDWLRNASCEDRTYRVPFPGCGGCSSGPASPLGAGGLALGLLTLVARRRQRRV